MRRATQPYHLHVLIGMKSGSLNLQEPSGPVMEFSAVVKGNHSDMVLLDTPLHGDAVTDASKLPWHKYLNGL